MNSAFFYPARRHDRALSAAGQIERLARAAFRHLRAGRLGQAGGAIAGSLARRAGGGAAVAEANGGQPATGAPVLYLPAVSWSYRFQRPQHLALALRSEEHT